MKRFISIMLVGIVFITCLSCISVSAEDLSASNEEDIEMYYLYTDKCTSTLTINSRTATCKSIITGYINSTTKIVITQTLQKKSGTSWTKVDSWTKTANSFSTSFTNTKTSLASGTYRVRTVAKVYKGTAYETVKKNSATKTI